MSIAGRAAMKMLVICSSMVYLEGLATKLAKMRTPTALQRWDLVQPRMTALKQAFHTGDTSGAQLKLILTSKTYATVRPLLCLFFHRLVVFSEFDFAIVHDGFESFGRI